MSTSISTAFIAKYEAEVKLAYQQEQSKLRNLVRLKTGVVGATSLFQKAGKGTAGSKTRHGNVPLMNAAHTNVTAIITDAYAADYIDKLDELKTNIDERKIVSDTGAYALARETDSRITTVLSSGAGTTDSASTAGLTRNRALTAVETLVGNDVPFDSNVFGAVGPHQWAELMTISEFADADYVGADGLPWKMGPWMKFKEWAGVKWVIHTGLPLASGVRDCFIWHKLAVGFAEGMAPTVSIDWVPEKAAHLIDHMMSSGAVAIDGDGIYKIQCDDDLALT